MKKDNKIIDDLARLANSTFTGMVNVKNELSGYITQQTENLIKKMNFVTREEFDVVKKVVQENRILIEKISTTIRSTEKPKIRTEKK